MYTFPSETDQVRTLHPDSQIYKFYFFQTTAKKITFKSC